MRSLTPRAIARTSALLAFVLLPSAASTDPTHVPWTGKPLRAMGWTYVRSDGQAAHYVKLPVDRTKKGQTTIWGRTEYSPAAKGTVRSEADYMDIDCAHGRLRALRMMQYTDNNLAGTLNVVTSATEWAHVPPSSLGEVILKIGCAHRQERP